MLLKEAMFLWGLRDEDKIIPFSEAVKVVRHSDHEGNRKHSHLLKSMGACWGEWHRATDVQRAIHAVMIFHRMVALDGVEAKEAHNAFMAISEYHAYADGDRSDGNPFAQAYWSLGSNELPAIDSAFPPR
jgi:hypothetical protein